MDLGKQSYLVTFMAWPLADAATIFELRFTFDRVSRIW
jgi:hypothetical protein